MEVNPMGEQLRTVRWLRDRVDGGSEKYDYNKRHYEQNLSEFWIIYGDIGGVDTYLVTFRPYAY